MRHVLVFVALFGLTLPLVGCGSGMADASLKPDVTGNGPKEPGGPVDFKDAPKSSHH